MRLLPRSRSPGILNDVRLASGLINNIRQLRLSRLRIVPSSSPRSHVARLVDGSSVTVQHTDADLVCLGIGDNPFTLQIGELAYVEELRIFDHAVRQVVDADIGGVVAVEERRAAQRARLHRDGLFAPGADFARFGFGAGLGFVEADVVDVVGVGPVDEGVHVGTHVHGARGGSLCHVDLVGWGVCFGLRDMICL